ncbi:MAG: hypothetical protein ACRET0_10950, partial [Steroidobacteraceae bacterium]
MLDDQRMAHGLPVSRQEGSLILVPSAVPASMLNAAAQAEAGPRAQAGGFVLDAHHKGANRCQHCRMEHYEILVIGTGPAGEGAAMMA